MRYKPMLAYKVGKKKMEWNDSIYLQPKLDGVRCLIQREVFPISQGGARVVAYSRTGKEWKNINHILEELTPFFQKYPDVVLDGELYNHELRDDFEKIISLVRKKKPTDEDRSEAKEMVQYHVYDIIDPDSDKPFSLRNNFIKETFSYQEYARKVRRAKILYPSIKTLTFGLVQSRKHAYDLHKLNVKAGYEGSILRLDKSYEQKRSYNLQKFKDFHDAEAIIVGYEEGKGKRVGTLGKFVMQDEEGVQFGCPPGKGFNYKDLRNILNNIHDYIGQEATFTYFERTKAGSYRHPLFKTIRNYE